MGETYKELICRGKPINMKISKTKTKSKWENQLRDNQERRKQLNGEPVKGKISKSVKQISKGGEKERGEPVKGKTQSVMGN